MKINAVPVQSELVSGTNIKTINSTSLLGSGDVAVQATLVSGTNIVTINSTSLLGSGNISVQPTLVSGTNIVTINGSSLLGSGNLVVSASPSGVAGAIQFSNGSAFSSDATNLFFDDTNNRLGVGTNAPTSTIHSKGSGATNATTSLLIQDSAGNNSLQCTDDLSVFSHGKGGVATNTIFGKGAFQGTSPTGANNTAFGATALAAVTSGAANTAIGSGALSSITTGANNTVIGAGSLASASGSSNTAVGGNITCNHSNCTLLGYGATSTANNQMVFVGGTLGGGAAIAGTWSVIINGVARRLLFAI